MAGGRSRRMGRDKALLAVCGEPLWQRQIRLSLACGATRAFLSVRPDQELGEAGVERIEDARPDLGPLSGLASSLFACRESHLLVLAVDMPLLNEDIVRDMLARCGHGSGVIPHVDGKPQPVSAIYTRRCLDGAVKRLGQHSLAVADWAEECIDRRFCLRWDVPVKHSPLFANWNVPSDLPEPTRHENSGL